MSLSQPRPMAARTVRCWKPRGLVKRYGGVVALAGMNLTVERGTVHGVIGPNGAGKSTLVGLLGGAIAADEGTIRYDGADIGRLPAPERARWASGAPTRSRVHSST